MHWVIFGCGAVGAYFGGRLIQTEQDEKITWLVRGKTLEALRTNGISIKSICGDYEVPSSKVGNLVDTNNLPSSVPDNEKADVVILACKTWQAVDALRMCSAWVGKDTTIFPLQNGVEGVEVLQDICQKEFNGRGHTIAGFANIVCALTDPAAVKHWAVNPPIFCFGAVEEKQYEDYSAVTTKLKKMEKIWMRCPGMETLLPDDVRSHQWDKFAFITSTSAIDAASGATQDQIIAMPELREIWIAAMTEVMTLAHAQNIHFPEEWIEDRMNRVAKKKGGTTSLGRDIRAGRPSELEELSGSVVRIGKRLGIPTPTHRALYSALLVKEHKVRKEGLWANL